MRFKPSQLCLSLARVKMMQKLMVISHMHRIGMGLTLSHFSWNSAHHSIANYELWIVFRKRLSNKNSFSKAKIQIQISFCKIYDNISNVFIYFYNFDVCAARTFLLNFWTRLCNRQAKWLAVPTTLLFQFNCE